MRKVAVLALVLPVLAVAWWWWPRSADAAPPATLPADAAPTTPPAVAVESAPIAAPTAPADDAAQRIAAPPSTPAEDPRAQTTLHGRCIDEQGNPIADVQTALLGWGANSERMDAWRKDHDEPKRIDEKVASSVDGVFAFRCWPPPPFQFALRLTKAGVATMNGRWSSLEPGSTKDLGDLRLLRGTLLRGRVVESDGMPVAGVDVRFDNKERRSDELQPESSDSPRTKADGTFVGRWALAAGTYRVQVPSRELDHPREIAITAVQPEQIVDVVLTKIDEAATIAGIVVDELGKPLRGVEVLPIMDGTSWIQSTDTEGRFRLVRPQQGASGTVGLRLRRDGYEWEPTDDRFAWGRTDLRFTMRKGLAVELLVVAADGGGPVEDYQARIFPRPGTRSSSSSQDFRVRTEGHHDGGRAIVDGVARGKDFVIVEPKDSEFAASPCVPIEVADPGPVRVTVSLSRTAQRPLHVQFADGTPVANAKVRLVDPNGNAVTPQLQVATTEQLRWSFGHTALQLQEVTSDARGDATLRGPTDRQFALLLPGPGHVPAAIADVSLAASEPLVVSVSAGARLIGTIVPPEAIAELRRLSGVRASGALGQQDKHLRPSVVLHRTEGAAQVEHPDGGQPATIGEDGSFEISGAPPGAWRVAVSWWTRNDAGASGSTEEFATVDLRDGATTSLTLDLSRLLPGTLDGLVLHNGAPLAKTSVLVVCSLGKDASGYDRSSDQRVETDSDGRFRVLTRASQCTVAWSRQRGDQWYRLRAAGSIDVVAGQTVTQTFRLVSGTVRARLLDAQGKPAARVAIELRDGSDAVRQSLPPTGDDGSTSGEIEPETFTATVLPRRLQDQKAQQELWQQNRGNPDPFATVRLRLGSVSVQAGATSAIELRLPAEWGQ